MKVYGKGGNLTPPTTALKQQVNMRSDGRLPGPIGTERRWQATAASRDITATQPAELCVTRLPGSCPAAPAVVIQLLQYNSSSSRLFQVYSIAQRMQTTRCVTSSVAMDTV